MYPKLKDWMYTDPVIDELYVVIILSIKLFVVLLLVLNTGIHRYKEPVGAVCFMTISMVGVAPPYLCIPPLYNYIPVNVYGTELYKMGFLELISSELINK